MIEGKPEKPAPAARKRKRHPIRNTLLILLALALLFHRPILIAMIHSVAIEIAAKQNVRLSMEVGGTIFTNLSLRNVNAVPNGEGPTPVENISIEEIAVQYSILSLLRQGESEFLQSYRLRNATIAVKPVEGTSEQKSDLASTLHDLIQQPALFSNRVEIDNLNLIAHVPDGDFEATGLELLLDPVEQGSFSVATLQIPKVRTWHDLKATTTYANRDMILSGLELDPQIVVEKLDLDASQRAKGLNRLDVVGRLFGGDAEFSLRVQELPGKHENNVSKALAQVDSTMSNLSLERVSQYFHVSTPAIGSVSEATVHLIGDPNTPSSWTGAITGDMGEVQAGSMVLDKANMWLNVSKGWATLGSALFSGSNNVTLHADGKLPDSLDGFAGSAITGWLDISAGDLHHFAGDLDSGSVNGNGTFDLSGNDLKAGFDLKARSIFGKEIEVSEGEFSGRMMKVLTSGSQATNDIAALAEGFEAHVEASGTDIRAGDYAIDSVNGAVSVSDGIVRIEKASATRAKNTVEASGSYTLPHDLSAWDRSPGSIEFSMDAPSIAAFRAEPDLTAPDGSVEAGGTLENGPQGCNGSITANVAGLHMQDFSANGLNLAVSIHNSVASIDKLVFALNATDGFSTTGHVDLRKPYTYDGTAQGQIHDLSVFNAFIPKRAGGIGGAVTLNWSGSGDLETLAGTGNLQFSMKNGKAAGVQGINAAIAGSYSPEQLDFPAFSVTSSRGDVSAVIAARNDVLRVNDIVFKQGGRAMLTGSVAIPLDLRTPAQPDTLVPSNGPIFADLASGNIALDGFFAKGEAPVTGSVQVTVTARGSVDQPNARVIVAGRNLQAKAAPALAARGAGRGLHAAGRAAFAEGACHAAGDFAHRYRRHRAAAAEAEPARGASRPAIAGAAFRAGAKQFAFGGHALVSAVRYIAGHGAGLGRCRRHDWQAGPEWRGPG